jgi:hypothetical protein
MSTPADEPAPVDTEAALAARHPREFQKGLKLGQAEAMLSQIHSLIVRKQVDLPYGLPGMIEGWLQEVDALRNG